MRLKYASFKSALPEGDSFFPLTMKLKLNTCDMQLKGSGVQLHIAYPGMTQTAMLDAMDARTKGLIDELPGVTIYPREQVGDSQACGSLPVLSQSYNSRPAYTYSKP